MSLASSLNSPVLENSFKPLPNKASWKAEALVPGANKEPPSLIVS